MVEVATGGGVYERFQLQGFDWESFGVLDWGSLMGGGRLREVVVHGGSTVFKAPKVRYISALSLEQALEQCYYLSYRGRIESLAENVHSCVYSTYSRCLQERKIYSITCPVSSCKKVLCLRVNLRVVARNY